MRFAIWSGAASRITMPTSMEKARHVLNVRHGWRAALGRLREVLDWNNAGAGNQITKLEINCHGLPGRLLLPDLSVKGVVDHTSVQEFASLLKPNLVKGALIELLACSVAGVEFSVDDLGPVDFNQPKVTYSKSLLEEYWGAYDIAPTLIGHTDAPATVQTGNAASRTRKNIAIAKQYEWGPDGNGLRFCLALAAGTDCVVRASDVLQWETLDNDPRIAVDAIGNWEGHVWNFYPDGKVKYLGMDVSRSQGSIAFSGDHLATIGSRPMGAIEQDSPLRGQRLNRVPLAV
jgi:hypothetical protein